MFTGIIERTARVVALEDRPGSRLIRVAAGPPGRAARPIDAGESIAVNGACLTAVESGVRGGSIELAFEVVPETLRLTTLGSLEPGEEVNFERALAAGDLLGGHLLTGHVDGVGAVRARRPEGDQVLFEIEAPADLLRQVIRKGSIAVDGVSLTVVDVGRREGWFSFAAIPHTLERTALKARAAGSRVNLETDVFGKWVLHAVGDLAIGEIRRRLRGEDGLPAARAAGEGAGAAD
jgi:riboflavin synthase